MDLLKSSGGNDSLTAMAKNLGVGGNDIGKLVGALAPSLMRGLQKQAQSPAGLESLTNAISNGQHEKYLDSPDLVADEATRLDGDKILGHIFGSKDVSRNVAAFAEKDTGIDASILKKALPLLAGLAMGALSKKGPGAASGFDPGMLGNSDDEFGMDDVLDLAKKFF